MIPSYLPEDRPGQYGSQEIRNLFLMVGENAHCFDGRLVMKNSSGSFSWDDFLQVTNIVVHLFKF